MSDVTTTGRGRGIPSVLGCALLLVAPALHGAPAGAFQATGAAPPNPISTGIPVTVVRISAAKYTPADITLKIGQAVKFENDDTTGHTVTASDGSFDSGLLLKGGTWQTTFARAGTMLYSDIYHSSMHGRIFVIVN